MNSKAYNEAYGLSVTAVPEVTRAVARLEYESHGTLAASILKAVVLTVNGKEAAKLDIPEEIGDWSEPFDILPFLIHDSDNKIEIAVNTYDFKLAGGRIETNATAKIYIGSKRIFSERYSTRHGFRRSVDELVFKPSEL